SYLPPIGRAVMPVDLMITRKQHYDPFDQVKNQATGTYSASIPHGPGHFRGEYFLTETGTGSQLRLASECKVHIPLVGGALEDLIMHHITDIFETEEAFTPDWPQKHPYPDRGVPPRAVRQNCHSRSFTRSSSPSGCAANA